MIKPDTLANCSITSEVNADRLAAGGTTHRRSGTRLVWRGLGILAAIVALFLLGAGAASAGGPWFVSPSGNDANDCQTLGTPCLTVGAAIGKASSGDTINV